MKEANEVTADLQMRLRLQVWGPRVFGAAGHAECEKLDLFPLFQRPRPSQKEQKYPASYFSQKPVYMPSDLKRLSTSLSIHQHNDL